MRPTGQLVCALILLSVLSAEASWFSMPSFGRCPDLSAKQSFQTDINKFLQTWYVQSSSNTDLLLGDARCMSVNYKYNNVTRVIHVVGKQYEEGAGWNVLEANAFSTDAATSEAKFSLTFTIPIYGKMSGTFTVLDTDYENYAAVHGCGTMFYFLHYESTWLMSRKQKLTAAEERSFNEQTSRVLEKYDGLGEFKKVDQVKC